MPTYRVALEYDGTDFVGLQFQPLMRSVAGEVETAISGIFAEPIKVTAAGRTDAGVHATGQVVSFTANRDFPIDRLALAMNSRLPPDITAREAARVDDGFSARHDAKRRTYEYLILNRRQPNALLRRFSHQVYGRIDPALFAAGAEQLLGEFDFVAFCGVLPEKGGTVRRVIAIDLEREDDLLRVRIAGDGFLHRMVRIIVGTLLEVAMGRRAVDDVAAILASKDRRRAGYTAPAEGLFLAGVQYDGFDSYRKALT